AADLQAFGAEDFAVERAEARNRELALLARRSAAAGGLTSGLSALVAGLTLWAVLILGVAAGGSGTLGRVPLAGVPLTAPSAFEAVRALPPAAIALSHSRSCATRIAQVVDAPDPVTDPADPRPLPALAGDGTGSFVVRLTGAQVRYEPEGPLAIDG